MKSEIEDTGVEEMAEILTKIKAELDYDLLRALE